ncbi:serine/threonine protein kinase [Collinsella intestinalis]|uniref:serine/threonine protein kinase n=1 Tax=Collinsella intestinalis TaxID=147207 RepID=UPI00195E2286|nr:serine/threonine-protein kinase [Collinsella intestinalis]
MSAMDETMVTDDGLDAYLDAVARSDAYRVERTLGSRDGLTELVYFAGEGGTRLGPFVRKRIELATGLGGAYEELLRAQCAGRRFCHLPRVVECYKTGSELVVVTEYVPGETLAAYVARRGGSPALAREVFPVLCEAVAELHGVCDPPLIHRDLKPQNVIIAPEGLFLIDFGIARRYRDDAASDTVHLGTRAYAPPEQYGFGQTDVRSDVYALGQLLAFCLTGEEPRPGFDTTAHAAEVTPALAPVFARATAFDPAERYADVPTLAEAFAEAVFRADALSLKPATKVAAPASAVRTESAPVPATGAEPAAPSAVRTESAGPSAGAAATTGAPSALTEDAPPAAVTRAASQGSRLPWGGIAWNVTIAVFVLVCFAAVVNEVLHPSAANAGKPLWYLGLLGLGLVFPAMGGMSYLACNRPALALVLPVVARRTRRQDALVLILYLVIVFAILVVVTPPSAA